MGTHIAIHLIWYHWWLYLGEMLFYGQVHIWMKLMTTRGSMAMTCQRMVGLLVYFEVDWGSILTSWEKLSHPNLAFCGVGITGSWLMARILTTISFGRNFLVWKQLLSSDFIWTHWIWMTIASLHQPMWFYSIQFNNMGLKTLNSSTPFINCK